MKSAIKSLLFNKFSKFKTRVIKPNKSHLDLSGFKTMSKFVVARINSEKCFGIQKSKFHRNLSEGKADFHCKFKPWVHGLEKVRLYVYTCSSFNT